ncbi:hypothetical protein PHYPO_G00100970 [Pangasianodon hypophthalmus]|uniref:Uncharacterized protein n=1 Tax=Pangasianodon hypophthalmus TaxID=310915 RepID=A0A5N5PWD9_PANHP|nr:hypothetical protein PHYPO_G00100970 [Pangasianodon hypophthalmus]
MLPKHFRNLLPAFLTHKKAYLAYLLSVQNIRDVEAGLYGQRTITGALRKNDTPAPFGGYEDTDWWHGVSVTAHYLVECLLQEYQRQEAALTQVLQRTFGQSESEQSLVSMYCGLANRYSAAGIPKAKYQWVDRGCCAAFRVMDPAPYEHLQWDAWRTTEAIVAEVTAGNLKNLCASCLKYNEDIIVKLDLFHCMRRFTGECVSEHHPLYSSFCLLLSAAFSVVDQSDLEKLKNAYKFCGIEPANPTKQHIREHCRTKDIPENWSREVEEVLQHFHLAKDPNNILLFKPSMLKLNHVKGEGAGVPIWIPVRGTSQQEGFHFHPTQWVTGKRVSPELFQAQGMIEVSRCNYQWLVDLKQPGVILPAVFGPVLMIELNRASVRVTGQPKYPALHICNRDTGERFGLQYVEPGCRPVPLDFDKHKCKKSVLGDVEIEEESSSGFESSIPSKEWLDDYSSAETPLAAETEATPQIVLFHQVSTPSPVTVKEQRSEEFLLDAELLSTPPLPIAASPRAARIGPIKTGGRVFVLEHNRWTDPMKNAIDGLLAKHHGSKDLLKRVDADYAAMVSSQQYTDTVTVVLESRVGYTQWLQQFSSHRYTELSTVSDSDMSASPMLGTDE